MPLDTTTLAATAADYAAREPRDIVRLALEHYAPDIAISFSGVDFGWKDSRRAT